MYPTPVSQQSVKKELILVVHAVIPGTYKCLNIQAVSLMILSEVRPRLHARNYSKFSYLK
jgi:hypothetical protein